MQKSNYIIFIFIATVLLLIFTFLFTENEGNNDYQAEIIKKRNAKDRFFEDSKDSPLSDLQKKQFSKLTYFEIDPNYKVKADLELLNSDSNFVIMMTKNESSNFLKYAYADFVLQNKKYRLTIFKGTEKHNQNYFFIPFTDQSNGKDSYEVGRYLEIKKPQNNLKELFLDFNEAYNPYCAYNKEFSCPIPPSENHLETSVLAGEKMQ